MKKAIMKRKYFIKLIVALAIFMNLFFVRFANGQQFNKNATSGFQFLQIPVSSKYAGMAEAAIAIKELKSDAIFHNPGILGFIEDNHLLSFSYAPYFADIKSYSASYLLRSDFGVFAIGSSVFDYGQFDKTLPGVYQSVGKFSAASYQMSSAYSKRLTDKFAFGIALKYVEEKIDNYKASNILFDGGVLYYTGFNSLRIAAAIQHFGVDAKFINDPFKMPSVLKIGFAYELFGNYESDFRVTVMSEALHPNDADEKVNAALEIGLLKTISLRGGYKFFYDEETFSLGIGFCYMTGDFPIDIDYSYSDYGRLGGISRLSVSIGLK
jgi:hypothetical protein